MRKFIAIALLVILVFCTCAVVGCDLPDSNGTRYVEFYAVNDFHGTTDKLAKTAGFLNDKKGDNTIILSSGDMFQETLESNWNYGTLVNACMEKMGIECMAIGNHEFDWGLEKLQALKEQTSVKFLGANIYHWDRNTGWGTFADELAEPYYIRTLENGLKVGIIGVIGSDQITSISSNLVQTIGFKEPSEVVPDLATKLRHEEKCDVVVLSIHHGINSSRGTIGTIDDQALDATKHVDAVFGAHTHRKETEQKDGVPFIQGASNGRYVSNVCLEVDKDGNVTCTKSQNIAYSDSWIEDAIVANMVRVSNDQIASIANEVLANLTGSLNQQGEYGVPRLVCKAIAEFAKNQGYDIDIALMNQARNSVYSGAVTYTELFHALPFDNIVYIAEVSGRDLVNQCSYGNFWRVTSEPIIYSGTYTIAVIDYVLFNQDSARQYRYFPSAFTNGRSPIPLVTKENPYLNYRDITKAYLLQAKTVNTSEFSDSNTHCNADKLSQSVTFTDAQATAQLYVGGALADIFAW